MYYSGDWAARGGLPGCVSELFRSGARRARPVATRVRLLLRPKSSSSYAGLMAGLTAGLMAGLGRRCDQGQEMRSAAQRVGCWARGTPPLNRGASERGLSQGGLRAGGRWARAVRDADDRRGRPRRRRRGRLEAGGWRLEARWCATRLEAILKDDPRPSVHRGRGAAGGG